MVNRTSQKKQNSEAGSFNRTIKNPTVILGIILLIGAALRVYDLGTESYWIDEMYSIDESQQSIHQILTSGRFDQPPAYYLPFHYWLQLFGDSEVSTRFFSVIVGVGSIFLIYLIGSELFSKKVGLVSAFIMAITGFQISYSQFTRTYNLFVFLTQLSFLFFILALKRKRTIYFILNSIASVLMLFSHLFGVFILSAQYLFFFFYWKKYRELVIRWLICQAVVLATYLPYFFIVATGVNDVGGAIVSHVGPMSTPMLTEPLHSLYRFVLPSRLQFGQELVFFSFAAAGVLFIIGMAAYIKRVGLVRWRESVKLLAANLFKRSEDEEPLLLVSSWLICPILVPFILSLLIIPIYSERYAICAAPALYLLMAFLISRIHKVVPVILSLIILSAMIVPGLRAYYVNDVNEQWIEAAEYIEENSLPNDVLVFAPNSGARIQQKTFEYYYQDNLPGCGIQWNVSDSEAKSILAQCVSGRDRFWVLMRGTNNDKSYNRFATFFLKSIRSELELIEQREFVGISMFLFEMKN